MALPWLQIVNLMPTILDVSRELLRRTRKTPSAELPAIGDESAPDRYDARLRALEDNERRQAELVTTMADQLSQLTLAAQSLHKVTRWLIVSQVVTTIIAIVAVVWASRVS
jgi:hypothetical protein